MGFWGFGVLASLVRKLEKLAMKRVGTVTYAEGCYENFEEYNNIYGYKAANEFLRTIALTITKAIDNSENLVARYQNEEFAIILHNTIDNELNKIAKAIKENIKKIDHHHTQADINKILTVSMGIASTTPSGDFSPIETLLIPAEEALEQFQF